MAVALWWIAQDPENRAADYLDYGYILDYEKLRDLPEIRASGLVDEAFWAGFEARREEVTRGYERVRERFIRVDDRGRERTLGWPRGRSIRDLAEEAGAGFEYRIAYRIQSSLEHSDVYRAVQYVNHGPDGMREIDVGPSEQGIAEAIVGGYMEMVQILHLFSSAFEIDLHGILDAGTRLMEDARRADKDRQ